MRMHTMTAPRSCGHLQCTRMDNGDDPRHPTSFRYVSSDFQLHLIHGRQIDSYSTRNPTRSEGKLRTRRSSTPITERGCDIACCCYYYNHPSNRLKQTRLDSGRLAPVAFLNNRAASVFTSSAGLATLIE